MIRISMPFHIDGSKESLINPSTKLIVFKLIFLSSDSDKDNIIG